MGFDGNGGEGEEVAIVENGDAELGFGFWYGRVCGDVLGRFEIEGYEDDILWR